MVMHYVCVFSEILYGTWYDAAQPEMMLLKIVLNLYTTVLHNTVVPVHAMNIDRPFHSAFTINKDWICRRATWFDAMEDCFEL